MADNEIHVTDDLTGQTYVFPEGTRPEVIQEASHRARGTYIAGLPPDQRRRMVAGAAVGPSPSPAPSPGIGQRAADLGIGALKGAGSTLWGAGNLLAAPFLGYSQQRPQALQPSSPEQVGGMMGEQAGEFLLPGGIIGRGAKALEGATAGMRGAEALNLLGRSAMEAGSAGTVAGLQGGSPGPAAAIAAGIPVVGKALSAVAEPLKRAGLAAYAKAFPASGAAKVTAAKVMPGMLRRVGITLSLTGAAKSVEKNLETAGRGLEEAVDSIAAGGATADTAPVLQALDDYKYASGALVDAGGGNIVPVLPNTVSAIDELKKVVRQFGPDPPFDALRRLRQVVDSVIEKSKGFQKTSEELSPKIEAWKELRHALRTELADKGGPDFTAMNKEYSFWRGVQDVVENVQKRRMGQQGTTVTPEVMAAGVGAMGGSIPRGLEFWTVVRALRGIIRSPAWRTTSGVALDRLADSMATGNIQAFNKVAGRILAGLESKNPEHLDIPPTQ